ncbi:THO complex subunit [Dirofilaria immitis]
MLHSSYTITTTTTTTTTTNNNYVMQMNTKRNSHLFGRQSASRTGELFYRTPKNLNYDPSLKSGIFLQMFFDYCTPSLWTHKFQTAKDLIRDAMKHLDAEIKCNGSNFIDMQMREGSKLKEKR